jgi:hypothetical protein
MDFYWIVTMVAAVLLILGLVIFGMMVKNVDPTGSLSSIQPNVCPDYWTMDASGACAPVGSLNAGKLPYVNVVSAVTATSAPILFTDPAWKKASSFFKTDVPAECTLAAWSTANHILWDGITNDPKCAKYDMTDALSQNTTRAPTSA